MASVFRRSITSRVISVLKPLLYGEDKGLIIDGLPLCLKFSQIKQFPPQYELYWRDVLKIKPDISERMHFATALTYLKNQDFPATDGITGVDSSAINEEKFIFTVDQNFFSSTVLLDVFKRITKIPAYSTFFKNIPPLNVILEYSSPNIAKPFHLGHFRSTVHGNFIANLFDYVGHKVTRINYIGDWGLQYGILAVGYKKFGSEEKLKSNALQHLFEVYVKANEENVNNPSFSTEAKEYFLSMEKGDKEALALWQKLRELSLHEMKQTYKRLNIHFDEIHGESMYTEKVNEVYDLLLERNLASRSQDGSIEFSSSEKEKSEEPIVLRRNDGTSLYITRDIAAAIDRYKKFHFDAMYYVVDSTQRKHFLHLFKILKSMQHEWAYDLHHVPFRVITGFSARKGKAVFLNDILDEATQRTKESMEK